MAQKSASPDTAPRPPGRPFALDPLFRRLTGIPGIGQRTGKLFEKLIGAWLGSQPDRYKEVRFSIT